MKTTTMGHFLIGLAVVFFFFSGLDGRMFGQAAESERPRLKDFGSSLKKKNESKEARKKVGDTDSSEDTIKVNTDLVVNDILVLDEKGSFVIGLTPDDFVITENGEKQDVQFFALGGDAKIPRSIVLLIDHSWSEVPYIVSTIMSTKILVDNLNANDRMAIVTDNVELLCDFTSDKEQLKNKLESLKDRVVRHQAGDSRQYSALLASLNELFGVEDKRKIIIFQTDGDQINLPKKPFDLKAVMTAVERSRATIYSVFPGLKYEGLPENEKFKQAKAELETTSARFYRQNNPAFDLNLKPSPPEKDAIIAMYEKTSDQQTLLSRIAASTGGWITYLETPMQAENVYSKILQTINSRYAVGFYPKNKVKEGKRRVIRVEIKNHPEYRVEGRKTYIADGPEI